MHHENKAKLMKESDGYKFDGTERMYILMKH
jgi:hypothetical protein